MQIVWLAVGSVESHAGCFGEEWVSVSYRQSQACNCYWNKSLNNKLPWYVVEYEQQLSLRKEKLNENWIRCNRNQPDQYGIYGDPVTRCPGLEIRTSGNLCQEG